MQAPSQRALTETFGQFSRPRFLGGRHTVPIGLNRSVRSVLAMALDSPKPATPPPRPDNLPATPLPAIPPSPASPLQLFPGRARPRFQLAMFRPRLLSCRAISLIVSSKLCAQATLSSARRNRSCIPSRSRGSRATTSISARPSVSKSSISSVAPLWSRSLQQMYMQVRGISSEFKEAKEAHSGRRNRFLFAMAMIAAFHCKTSTTWELTGHSNPQVCGISGP